MNKTKTLALTCLIGLAMIVPACQPAKPRVSAPDSALPAQEDSAAFLDRISSTPTVNENDAMRAVIILLEGKDNANTFQERVDYLSHRGIVANDWDFSADRPITKGKLAYMLCQACEIGGGITMMLTGPTQRYCLRELQYERMISDGAFYNQVTGMELVGIIQRADTYRQHRQVPNQFATPPISLGG